MTAPITPDERAAMRETIATLDAAWEVDDPTRPLVTEHAALALLAHVASAVPRLLDALDTAEAEAARLLAERTAAHADDATCASCTHEYVADMERHVDEADAKIDRQADRLRAREEQVRRLRAEVTRLHALVATERAARSAPVWDEDTVTEAVASALREHGGWSADLPDDEMDCCARAVLAVVREHLPVRPDQETVIAAERAEFGDAWDVMIPEYGATLGWVVEHTVPSILALWPGESRATVQAEALHDAADEWHAEHYGTRPVAYRWLWDRADRIEKGADRG